MKTPITLLCTTALFCGISHAQQTQLGLDRDAGIARINLQGESNRDYSLVASDLSSSNWSFLATLTLTNSSQSWFDSASAQMPLRFYRALKLASPTVPEFADDFRLIDHQGRSQ